MIDGDVIVINMNGVAIATSKTFEVTVRDLDGYFGPACWTSILTR